VRESAQINPALSGLVTVAKRALASTRQALALTNEATRLTQPGSSLKSWRTPVDP